jgi:hypothetical protein
MAYNIVIGDGQIFTHQATATCTIESIQITNTSEPYGADRRARGHHVLKGLVYSWL